MQSSWNIKNRWQKSWNAAAVKGDKGRNSCHSRSTQHLRRWHRFRGAMIRVVIVDRQPGFLAMAARRRASRPL
jgi:hypothetical protein